MRPLLPFADAFRERGHDVLIAIPESSTGLVLDAGHEAWALPQAPSDVSDAISARAHEATPDEANAIVVGELFAGTHARAALPGVMAAVAEWQPDVLVHETCEFAAALVGERAALPSVRVAVHMASLERYIAHFAAAEVDALRALLKIDRDPDGERLLAGPSITLTPPALDGGLREGHYREPAAPLEDPPGRWDGDRRPLVYVSFGTVAPHSGAFPDAYHDAIDQLAALDVRVLLNTGRRDPARARAAARGRARRALGARGLRAPPRRRHGLPRRRGQRAHGALGRRAARADAALRRSAAQRGRRRGGGGGARGPRGRPDRRDRPHAAHRARLRGKGGRDRRRGRLPAGGRRGAT